MVVFCALTKAQELPPIQNYSPKDYNAENQNWAISQSPGKLIYIANNNGLLEFNGAVWNLYASPNETILRSVNVVDDRVYTGCYMEFGFWKRDDFGVLQYTSLSQKTNTKLIEDEEFWNIINIDDWIVFQSLNRIYIYDTKDESVNIIDANNTITKSFKVNQNIYFQVINKGIFKIENGKDILFIEDDIVKNNEIVNVFDTSKGQLILTRDLGFYSFENDALKKWDVSANDLLSEVSVYNAIQLKDQSFVLGTISHGVIYLSEKGDFLYQINQDNGLLNNTILSLFEDIDSNIWLGLDNGVSYININSSLKIYSDHKGVLGSVYASAIQGGNLYLGTNQGLFYKKLEGKDNFKFIKGTQGQVWCLKKIDEILFCGHNAGTFIVDNDQAKKITNVAGTWNISKLKNTSNLLLQGNYDGLYVLEKKDNSWQSRNKIKGFNNSSRYFEVAGNEVFVNHEYKGIFNVLVDSSFYETKRIAIDSLIKGSNSGLIKYNDNISYASKNGVFKYDYLKKRFTKDSLLSTLYSENEYVSGKLILDEDKNLWIFTNSNISFVTQGTLTKTPKINNIPITKEERKSVAGYESVMSFEDGKTYLLGTSSGYITIDISKWHIRDFKVHLGDVINGSNKKNRAAIKLVDRDLEGDFKSTENNLTISFYAPEYNKYTKPRYQFQLLGMYDDWSDWSENPTIFFENLPFGDYTFNVRSKIGNKISGNIASYSFKIAKPWYISNLMLAFYALATILFSFFMHMMYKRYYRKKQQKLIEKNQRDIELTRVENEKEIIRIKNEQLKQDFRNKSKELAAYTVDVAKKNALLTQIKNRLTKIQDQSIIEPVLNIIDKNLNENDNWESFKEAFNTVDKKFLKKLKKIHPGLSSNDLKLCAYLRLNLSSKEIAPLFNISTRSVEIKRYRLRKKMNLSHEDNLVSYILEI
ncbi:triple tyrosine motif-containing protein [Aquimarina sp. MMG016]|uniref:helix-turn-helix and ligand-binding sensor domain-containing protein n=1 Tax=Aquimarina sp. MMG016 TaxID=2822690 RepID=UPI001B39F252|nr:triple tyrosine motif-containing protein [Aquimarina sp. MMG016]MBQ4822346.1 LuxR family transcriptional regulator [Aquimarina sp. MMG016]